MNAFVFAAAAFVGAGLFFTTANFIFRSIAVKIFLDALILGILSLQTQFGEHTLLSMAWAFLILSTAISFLILGSGIYRFKGSTHLKVEDRPS